MALKATHTTVLPPLRQAFMVAARREMAVLLPVAHHIPPSPSLFSHHAPLSALPILGHAADYPGSPNRRSPSPMTEIAERRRRRAHAGRTPPAHARQSPDGLDITANTDTAHDWPQPRVMSPQPRASSPQPQAHRDFSRLLQTTDQLAEQLQRASERLTYLTEYAGEAAMFTSAGLLLPSLPTGADKVQRD